MLQIKRRYKENIFHISPPKHMLWVLIRRANEYQSICFHWETRIITKYFFLKQNNHLEQLMQAERAHKVMVIWPFTSYIWKMIFFNLISSYRRASDELIYTVYNWNLIQFVSLASIDMIYMLLLIKFSSRHHILQTQLKCIRLIRHLWFTMKGLLITWPEILILL